MPGYSELDRLRDPPLSSVRALTLRLQAHLPSTADFPEFWDRLADALPLLHIEHFVSARMVKMTYGVVVSLATSRQI
ncbi:uncharacterized protein TRAVEDRAFT_53574 [Trametes versicolor FP-101664 SS1]|uniref:uncharacterized protein n=1 Tax=Trametes versicolor (strain FP-101664) TaxID=717944 RepID=UPI0004622239|nr:uncharacterized protein TRAVEDRAFT_53574 [Trametes versicolor FP-101664 SS1]EIW52146.1 hypothetical protein TRAVEDRAFT_53574 [Trametes versicolor FP-101664 SS1]